ncbi:MAG: hypothetical protein R3F43_18330 [bacterium]
MAIPVGGMDLALDITNATITGQAGIDANGFFINNGVISASSPTTPWSRRWPTPTLPSRAGLLPPDINGTGNSVCLTFTSAGVALEGFPVE